MENKCQGCLSPWLLVWTVGWTAVPLPGDNVGCGQSRKVGEWQVQFKSSEHEECMGIEVMLSGCRICVLEKRRLGWRQNWKPSAYHGRWNRRQRQECLEWEGKKLVKRQAAPYPFSSLPSLSSPHSWCHTVPKFQVLSYHATWGLVGRPRGKGKERRRKWKRTWGRAMGGVPGNEEAVS